ncbi:MAG: hypothetical protein Q4D63_00600 [Neisseria animaloris]|nr:hypothetical protein [Neisseria animaloris]
MIPIVPSNQVVFAMSPEHPPVLRVADGSRVRFETCDCFADQIRSTDDTLNSLDLGPHQSGYRPGVYRKGGTGRYFAGTYLQYRVGQVGGVGDTVSVGEAVRSALCAQQAGY